MVLIALEALLLLLFKAKGALLTLALISPYLLYIVIKSSKRKWIYISIYSSIIVILGILFITIPKFNELFIDKSGSYNILNGREYYWKWVTDYINSNPAHMIFGGSPVFLFEMYPGFYVNFVNPNSSSIPFAPFLCHSTILTTLAMGGIIGLIALVLHRIDK